MNRPSQLLLTLLLASACQGTPKYDARLEGVWVSNSEMTLSHLGSVKLPDNQLKFLRANLGELQFAFLSNRTAALFSSAQEKIPTFEGYQVTRSTQNSVSIKTESGTEATYYFVGDCMYLNAEWGYNEYFCRSDTAYKTLVKRTR